MSSTFSACFKAEADLAALMVKQKLLKQKHVLEEEEQRLQKRKEQLTIEQDIAAQIAKLSVLKTSSVSGQQ